MEYNGWRKWIHQGWQCNFAFAWVTKLWWLLIERKDIRGQGCCTERKKFFVWTEILVWHVKCQQFILKTVKGRILKMEKETRARLRMEMCELVPERVKAWEYVWWHGEKSQEWSQGWKLVTAIEWKARWRGGIRIWKGIVTSEKGFQYHGGQNPNKSKKVNVKERLLEATVTSAWRFREGRTRVWQWREEVIQRIVWNQKRFWAINGRLSWRKAKARTCRQIL